MNPLVRGNKQINYISIRNKETLIANICLFIDLSGGGGEEERARGMTVLAMVRKDFFRKKKSQGRLFQ